MSEFNKQTIVERIRKIMETAGRTEAEMLTAQNLCQKLMLRYNIDNAEIFVSDGDIGILEVENTFEGHETRYWTWDLLCRIGSPYNVEVIRTERSRPITFEKYEVYRLIGSTEDRQIVKSIFENILPVIRASRKLRWKEYTKRIPKKERVLPATFAKSYFNGYGFGLFDKLKADREDFFRSMDEENVTNFNSDTDENDIENDIENENKIPDVDDAIEKINNLVLDAGKQNKLVSGSQQKWELVVARKKQLVDEYIKKEFSHAEDAKDRQSKKHNSTDAFESGYVDGKQKHHGFQLEESN